MYLGYISSGYVWILCGMNAVSLPMSNTKAVPVVWDDSYLAWPLKDRHYDLTKMTSFV